MPGKVLLHVALVLVLAGCASRNTVADGLEPVRPASDIETVVELDAPPGNIAVGPDGRVYFTFHPEAAPERVKLAELLPGGSVAPFPDAKSQEAFATPLALRIDGAGRLWVLDHGAYAKVRPTLTAFDLATRAVVHRFEFGDDVAESGTMLNDLVVDDGREVIYIADTSAYEFDPCIIVYDIAKKTARRVLENHSSVKSENEYALVQGRKMKVFGVVTLQLDVDTIALSPDGEWVYYGPLTGSTLWRVPSAALRDPALDDDAVGAKVEAYSKKPTSDGGVAGPDGTVYLTAIDHDAIATVGSDRAVRLLVKDKEKLAWPDGLAVTKDGAWLYVSASELHHVVGCDLAELPRFRPYRLLRIRLKK